MMFEEVVESPSLCVSSHFSTVNVEPDRFNFQVKVTYENMAADVIDGTTPLVFSCAYFRNPIYA